MNTQVMAVDTTNRGISSAGTTNNGITSTTRGAFTWHTNITTTNTTTNTITITDGTTDGTTTPQWGPEAVVVAHAVAAKADGAASEAVGAADAGWPVATSGGRSFRRCRMGRPTAMPSCAGSKR